MIFFIRSMIAVIVVIGLLWLNNTSWFIDPKDGLGPRIIAHRGIHQQYSGFVRNNETCRAQQMAPMTHSFIENTLPSILAAFDAGADVVEVDVHRTTDNVLMLYHDWRLECQTDGHGETASHSSDVLRALDLGFGYTENGLTFPLRGSAIGQMPSLEDVLKADLGGRLLVNFKSRQKSDGERFVALLAATGARNKVFAVYGGEAPTEQVIGSIDGMRGYHRNSILKCLKSYMLLGWSGWVPSACRNRLMGVPLDYAPFIWGWPHKFTKRMNQAGTDVILWGAYDGSGFSSGIDDLETLAQVPEGFDGYIWTNRVEIIGPEVTSKR